MPLNNINWRPDAISPYESIWSIRKKFSILNCVNGKNFDIGLSGLLAKKKISSLESVDVIARTKIVSSFLRDHKDNFKNIFIDDYVLPRVLVNVKQKINTILRYCPQCLVEGFHSPIHQINWVENCPIHLRTLETLDDSRNSLYEWSCRHKLRRQSIFIYEDNNYVSQLEEIESYWLWGRRIKWPNPFSKQDLYRIGDYLRWMKKLARTAEVWNSSAAWTALGKDYCTSEEANVLLSIWRGIVPPPPSVEEILQRPVNVCEIQRIIFTETHIATSVDETIRTYDYSTLEYGLSWVDRISRRKNTLISVVRRAKSLMFRGNKKFFNNSFHVNNVSVGFNDFKNSVMDGCSYRNAFLLLDRLHKCLQDGMLPSSILGDWDISKTIGYDLNVYIHNKKLMSKGGSKFDLYKCDNWRPEIRLIVDLFSLYSIVFYIHKCIERVFASFPKTENFNAFLGRPYLLVKRDGDKLLIKIFGDFRLFVSLKCFFGSGGNRIRSSKCNCCSYFGSHCVFDSVG